MSGGVETELKLSATPDAIADILRDPAFFDAATSTREQISTYYDTADHAIVGAGLSLRVRRIGDRWVQTVKAEAAVAATLFAREEWERDIAGDVPELDDITIALAKALGEPQPDDLAPVFVTQVTRSTAIVEQDGSRIELVADRGSIAAGDRTAEIAEIELELVEGDADALFAFAARIGERIPVRLGVRSKSERGYALVAGSERKALKSEPIALAAEMDTAALFQAVAGACIRHFRLNEDLLLATGRPEPLHQSRVALRRLRSAFSIFRRMLAGAEFDRFRGELRWISGLLGDVRNIDVLAPRIADQAAHAQLEVARGAAAADLVAALDSARMRQLMLELTAWIAAGAWRTDPATAAERAQPAAVFAAAMLERLRRRIRKAGRDLGKQDEEARHQVRIVGKKLRYAAEFFADLFPGGKATRRRAHFLDQVAALQEALGELNDLASGRDLLARLGIADGEALLDRGRTPRKKLIAAAEGAYEGLVDAKRFWR